MRYALFVTRSCSLGYPMSQSREWTRSESPTQSQLTGIESAAGVAAATAKRGVLLERTAPGEWRELFLDGPESNSQDLLDASMTADAERVWFCGASGTFGYYDRAAKEVVPHTAPYDLTTTFASISVAGAAGEETVHAADRSGRMLRVRVNGTKTTIAGVSVPGDGTGFTEIVDTGEALFAADGSGLLYHSADGREWERARLAQTTVKALALDGDGLVAVDDGGTVYKDISLFADQSRTKQASPDISSPEEVTAAGGDIAVAGGGGALLTIHADGRAVRDDPGTDKTFYAAELLPDGSLVVGGDAGVIAEGGPRPN